MPEQYTITGVILPANDGERVGMRVQALERDMPSLERRADSAPEILGEATTDAQGGFQIIYGLEQFQKGEGIPTLRRLREKNADLSFNVFDKSGQPLSIKIVQAGDREYRADQIIFNVATALVVNIFVDAPPEPGTSEYEQLMALVAPVLADLPLTELVDDDIVFLSNELGLEQQREVEQRIEWLRRSALLAAETELPAECFYGWGRENVPAPLAELAAVPLKDLPAVLDKLTGFGEEKLRDALLAAVEGNIIPVGFRDRVDEFVRPLQRRNQVLHEVVAQLLDADTKAALAGYEVTTFDQVAGGENRGLDITDSEGKFSFNFYQSRDLPVAGPDRGFAFKVVTPEGNQTPVGAPTAIKPDHVTSEVVPVNITVPKPPQPSLEEQLGNAQIQAPAEILEFLKAQEIHTFADIRRKGGLVQLPDLPAAAEPALLRKLESLADLDRISSNITTSKALLDHNFDSVLAVADTPHSEFVDKLSNGDAGLSEPEAARFHLLATTQTQLLDNMLMKMAGDNANGFAAANGNGVARAAGLFPQTCGCSDCEAAVSPAAYLTALLDYALKHIRNNKNKIDLQFLVDTFHQPFTDLPTDCEAVEQQLKQVRICVEALRSFLGNRPLANPAREVDLTRAEGDYAFAAYAMLLNRIGTSYEEIRRVRSETVENRRALAERLGIDLTEPRPADLPNDDEQNGDELDQLFLDPDAKPPADRLLTEQVLEKLFGLSDTSRDPLSDGAKHGDDEDQITRWNLNGVSWGQNTDPEGMVHLSLLNPEPDVFRLELYQDRLRTNLLAAGETDTATGTVRLISESNNRLSGIFELAYTVDSALISITAIPAFYSWQLKHLRTLWSRQDHPLDAYADDATPRLPVIDPDLIGPDDFRTPLPKSNPADPDKAFDIWLKRRQFLDTKLEGLKTDRETKGINEILKQVLGDPLPDLDGLLAVLTKGGAADEIKNARDSVIAFGFSIESFTRLLSIRSKDQLASDGRNNKVTDQEWREVYSILTQALKAERFDVWQTAEQTADVNLGLEEFWFSVTEPKEGDWPPVSITGQPFIDPDISKLTDLPDWLAGKEAVALWKTRKTILEKISQELDAERQVRGVDAMLRLALGSPASGSPLQHDVVALKNSLGSADETVRSTAAKQIATDFLLTVESFNRLLEIKAANDQADPAKKPSAVQWGELFAILAPAHKVKHLYPVWLTEEKTAGLVYWKALKAKLPLWRAKVELRQAWQQALRNRSQPPIIDPTVIGADDLQHLIPGDPAFDLWKIRLDRLKVLRDELKTAREAEDPDTVAGLDQIIKDALGFQATDLEALDQERQTGHSIEKRLEQLNLGNSAFNYLLRVRGLAKANQPIVESEWETVYATLTQAKLQREVARMRAEEKDQSLTLAPDFFRIPKELSTPLVFLDLSTPRWLSTWQVRLDWQDTLQSRIDQENSIREALGSAINAVEETTLPLLRDALIVTSDAIGASLNEQAEWITARLLIDARSGGCRMTTRVAQALETLQTIIFNLRTGQFKQLAASPLSLVSDYFDEEWKWIGSYATWRSAMFVFLYPENILQPSLLRPQSPAFETLMSNTRSSRVSPEIACKEANLFADYFRDVCSLEIEATCQATTVMDTGKGCNRRPANKQSMFYMFGRAPSGKIYWSACEASGNSASSEQTFWQEVPGFKDTKVIRIVGAMPYRKKVLRRRVKDQSKARATFLIQSSYIHLFCVTGDDGKQVLKLARLDLDEFGSWAKNEAPAELTTPPRSIPFLDTMAVQTQSEFLPPGLVFYKYNEKQLYYRTLNSEGTQWDQSNLDWPSFLNVYDNKVNPDSGWRELKAVLSVKTDIWLLVTNQSNDLMAGGPWILKGRGQQVVNPGKSINFGPDFFGALAGPEDSNEKFHSDAYLFSSHSGTVEYSHLTTGFVGEANRPSKEALADLIQIAVHSGNGSGGPQMLAYKREKNSQAYYMYRYAQSGDSLNGLATTRAVPRVKAPLNLSLHQSATDLQQRRLQIIDAFALNADATTSVHTYLREAYYFVPMHLALRLQAAGQHLAALDAFRTIYDYEAQIAPPGQRNIYYGLELDAQLPDVPLYQQADGWLLDPLNPHSIAATRHLTYTRFTIMSVIRCLLEFADSEFAQETGESLAEARTLYLTALDLLNLPMLQQRLGICDDLIAELRIEPGKDTPAEVPAAVEVLIEELTRSAGSSTHVRKASAEAKAILQGGAEWTVKLAQARGVVREAIATAPLPLATGAMVLSKSNILKEQHALLVAQPLIDNTLQVVSKTAVTKIFAGVGVAAPALAPDPIKVLPAPIQAPLPVITPSLQFCIPPNPILKALRLHAELNLYKLRTCRNIAGLKRQLDLYAAPTDTSTGMPAIGGSGNLVLAGTATLHPSLYRYPVLIERTKQLVQLATQVESAMLSSLLNRDAEARTLLDARQQLGLAQAGVRLQDLRVGEGNDGVRLAELQQERAQIQIETYDDWLQTGANEYENEMILAYSTVAAAQRRATDASSSIQIKQSAIASAQLAAQLVAADPTGGFLAGGVGMSNFLVDEHFFSELNENTKQAIDSAAAAQIASINAALERRKDEWQLQKRLAEQDSKIGEQQKKLAKDHLQIATQERAIAGIAADNAKDSIEFLANKFSNVELFEWMTNVLEGVYRFFLQQATAMAKLAENQLAFQRQEVPPAFIIADYWDVPTESTALGNVDLQESGRRGLTGSARLLQDIYQLEQYAFNTEKRKLSLAKTISLSRLAPVEFERFRETGVMPFATPLELFDRGFPGHYLRLIKRVRTSVIALIPPIGGIHATLSTSGPSRVVIGGDVFQTVPIKREPEFMALSAPNSSTGVFELDSQPDMLLPFEGSGVEMTWEFNMPKAANAFDYRTIADVLITLEYTALYSSDYRQQVIQSLRPTFNSDRPFSFRNQFADQWYDLHNPAQTSTPMTVRFTTRAADFPTNVHAFKIQHVALYFVGANATSLEVPVGHLRFTAHDDPGTVGGSATSIDGVISTRRGNAGSWTAMTGKSPIGEWELALPDIEEMRNRFGDEDKNENIQDILLVITYSGRTPEWPT